MGGEAGRAGLGVCRPGDRGGGRSQEAASSSPGEAG